MHAMHGMTLVPLCWVHFRACEERVLHSRHVGYATCQQMSGLLGGLKNLNYMHPVHESADRLTAPGSSDQ